MKQLSELYNSHSGKDIYIIGTGTSFRVFPKDFFKDKITIGLNRAWQLIEVNYAITMVPHLNFPGFVEGQPSLKTTWVTKRDKLFTHANDEQKRLADENYYYFRTDGQLSFTVLDTPSEAGRVLDWVRFPHNEFLYLWTSISQTAVNLAANMGAKNIILVGCDNSSLSGNHHAQNQHTLWKGNDPNDMYMLYYEGLREIRSVLRQRNVNVLSLNPFLKLDAPEMDFKNLCQELERQELIHNEDIFKGISISDHNRRFYGMFKVIVRKNLKHFKNKLMQKSKRES